MNRMPEKCDPFIYYNRVRPYIFGWKNNPTTPEGVIYEGVEEYERTSHKYLEARLGLRVQLYQCWMPYWELLTQMTHLKEYLDEMRLYMPRSIEIY